MKNHLSSNIYREEVVSRTSTFVDGFSKHVAFQLIHINYFPSREIAPSSIISEKLRPMKDGPLQNIPKALFDYDPAYNGLLEYV